MPSGWALTLGILTLVVVANGAPVVARVLLGARWGAYIDGGWLLADGRPLLGPTKTWRGVVAAGVLTSLVAVLLGLGWTVGLLVAAGAMLGDLAVSFVKRRLGWAASAPVPVLDQVPEALVPALLVRSSVDLTWVEVAVVVVGFVGVHLALGPIATRWGGRPGR